MAENKTKATKASVAAYLDAIPEEGRRKDCKALTRLMARATGQQPKTIRSLVLQFREQEDEA
ncbi:MAG TPA: hypothetical protein VFS34_05650 [Thermoanaerobaculia bacterium]|nr:hypothetical protein [Thermoanaerobaculia bacterium]